VRMAKGANDRIHRQQGKRQEGDRGLESVVHASGRVFHVNGRHCTTLLARVKCKSIASSLRCENPDF
jgi:hypothetical protein